MTYSPWHDRERVTLVTAEMLLQRASLVTSSARHWTVAGCLLTLLPGDNSQDYAQSFFDPVRRDSTPRLFSPDVKPRSQTTETAAQQDRLSDHLQCPPTLRMTTDTLTADLLTIC